VPNPDVINSRNIKLISQSKILEYKIRVGDGVFIVNKDKLNLPKSERKYLKPIFEPKELKKYMFPKEFEKEIIYITKRNFENDAPTLLQHLKKYKPIMEERRENKTGRLEYFHLHWPRDEYFFENGAKILCPRKCVQPTFVYTEDTAYVMMSFNVIKTNRLDLKYLTALLNSKLITFWFLHKGKMQGSNFQIDKEPLLQVPIVISDKISYIVTLLDKILLLKSQNSDTANIEAEIDVLMYKFYDLTFNEASVIDPQLSRNYFDKMI
jgi:adenine-specific DNA-methyltransferase